MDISTLLASGTLKAGTQKSDALKADALNAGTLKPDAARLQGGGQGAAAFTDTLAATVARTTALSVAQADAAPPAAGATQPALTLAETLMPLLTRLPAAGQAAAGEPSEPLSAAPDTDAGEDTPAPLIALLAPPPTPANVTAEASAPAPTAGATNALPGAPLASAAPGAEPALDKQASALAADRLSADGERHAALSSQAVATQTVSPTAPVIVVDGAATLTSLNPAAPAAHVAPLSAPAASATSLSPTLQAPLASSEWQQQLGQQLVSLSQRGEQRIELHLHPRELGPLSVSLKLDDQGAQAHFFSAHASVRGAVEQAIPQLREAFAEQGIALGEAMVGQHQQQQQNSFGDAQRHAGGGRAPVIEEIEEIGPAVALPPAPLMPGGGVDLYA
ncbi:flagellar hook-length control protein FliK [Alloalcanivorax mobilis]|uniref:flagellar hook-length control protein FliK n=1 Tax=Alloalcanivorax mobilis TaxID=2019569 RepID=UPI0018E44BC9|nr:flagellar hook-length control protein FliK [Alloalcanivorax mobilis]